MKRNIVEQRFDAITFTQAFYRNIMHAAKIRENVRLLRCADPGHFVLQQQQMLPRK